MIAGRFSVTELAWRPALAALGYAVLVAILVSVAYASVADILARRAAVNESADILSRLQARQAVPAGVDATNPPTGSPFLEGPTVTVAGAGLMQRVSNAVTRTEGRITSSQVELLNTQFGDGFVGVTTSLEIAQTDLQKLLYDLEAGMPFLFIDQLVAQGPAASGGSEDARMRVQLTVYGQWQNQK